MAENKTVANDGDVEAFIESIEDETRRNDAHSIMKMMEEITGESPTMWGTSIVGFGSYHYVYASGRKGDFMMTGFSPRKRNTSIYVMPGFSEYGDLLSKLGKHKLGAARAFARANGLDRVVMDSPKARFGIITTGKAYLDVLQALEDLGIDAAMSAEIGLRILKVGMSWPLEPATAHDFAKGLEDILVVEEKRPILEDQLTSQLYNNPVASRPRVVGEFDEQGQDLVPSRGELTPALVARAIARRVARFHDSEVMQARLDFLDAKERSLARPRSVAERTPHFCSGCPHNSSTRVPEGSHALGGIGCHYMATWMPDRPTRTYTQMGGEGAAWIGQAPFSHTPHVFQNLGDGTYFHSGSLAIRAAVAAGLNITYKILFNEAVAMTGGQPIDGELSMGKLVRQLAAEGVGRIALVSDDPEAWRVRFEDLPGHSIHHRD